MSAERDLQEPACRSWQEEQSDGTKIVVIEHSCKKCALYQRERRRRRRIKKFLNGLACGCVAVIFGLTFAWLLFFADDGSAAYTAQQAEEPMIKAIGGDYYYPASEYEQYLQERQAYIDELEAMEDVYERASWEEDE